MFHIVFVTVNNFRAVRFKRFLSFRRKIIIIIIENVQKFNGRKNRLKIFTKRLTETRTTYTYVCYTAITTVLSVMKTRWLHPFLHNIYSILCRARVCLMTDETVMTLSSDDTSSVSQFV